MYIRHHTHCSVESVAERGAAAPSTYCFQCVEEVIRLSKLQRRTCLTRVSRIGGTVHDDLKLDAVKPPLLNI